MVIGRGECVLGDMGNFEVRELVGESVLGDMLRW